MDPVTAFPRGPARARAADAAPETPSGPGRRHLLGLVAAGFAPAAAAQEGQRARPGGKGAAECQSFYGRHQAGIATPQPAAATVASFDVTAGSRDGLVALMKRLTVRTAALMSGEMPSRANDPVGTTGMADNLSMTVAFGPRSSTPASALPPNARNASWP